jgi:transcriptional regulator with XRE-family HTH domain
MKLVFSTHSNAKIQKAIRICIAFVVIILDGTRYKRARAGHVTHLSRYERGLSSPSLEVVQKIVEVLNISIDTLVFGQENIEDGINDKELASLFKKTQLLSDKQKQTVKDLISAFVFQKDIQKQLA